MNMSPSRQFNYCISSAYNIIYIDNDIMYIFFLQPLSLEREEHPEIIVERTILLFYNISFWRYDSNGRQLFEKKK